MAGMSARERVRQQRRQQRTKSVLIWGGIGAALVVLVGWLILSRTRPSEGQAFPIMDSAAHVEVGTDPGPFNSDPPTSGRHYDQPMAAGFYGKSQASEIAPFPAGYLVHSLEHGYVILWYNCESLPDDECVQLQDQIRGVLDDENNVKVIAFPWDSLQEQVVLTSWGQMLRMPQFDPAAAAQFVRTNRNRAPEPQAP